MYNKAGVNQTKGRYTLNAMQCFFGNFVKLFTPWKNDSQNRFAVCQIWQPFTGGDWYVQESQHGHPSFDPGPLLQHGRADCQWAQRIEHVLICTSCEIPLTLDWQYIGSGLLLGTVSVSDRGSSVRRIGYCCMLFSRCSLTCRWWICTIWSERQTATETICRCAI